MVGGRAFEAREKRLSFGGFAAFLFSHLMRWRVTVLTPATRSDGHIQHPPSALTLRRTYPSVNPRIFATAGLFHRGKTTELDTQAPGTSGVKPKPGA